MNGDLPEPGYIEKVLAALEKHPHGSLLLIILVVAIGFAIYAWKH